ncbi:50S ribosomal protein L6 [Candidatus Woesearchaeota archaeon]|nr:50S ribosomal protein L6 [Candidatus Woesearchaeota archaeon]
METENKSRKAKKKDLIAEIKIPEGLSVSIDKGILTLKGRKGEVKKDFSDKKITVESKNDLIILKAGKFSKVKKKLIKSYAAHIKNMIKGSLEGHKYMLKICSGHFPMNVSVNKDELTVKNFLGEKVPRVLKLKEGAAVKVEGDKISVESASKEIAGQISADIEQLTRRTRYDLRIFQDGIYITDKDGKEVR